MKIIITETQSKALFKRLRRIQELRDSIEYQMEIQDPCNFDDGEEYADFCIGVGLSFFYGDEKYFSLLSYVLNNRIKIIISCSFCTFLE